MPQYLALLRGINVGKAKRIAMADLRALIESLGGADVRTLLNSGNVVFSIARASEATLGSLARDINQVHPYFLSIVIDAMLRLPAASQNGMSVESRALQLARARSAKILGLEELADLDRATRLIQPDEGIALLNRSIDFHLNEPAKALRKDWSRLAETAILNGDCDGLMEAHDRTFASEESLKSAYEKLYASRNESIARKIGSTYAPTQKMPKRLFLMGAYHVCGANSVLAHLREAGFVILAIKD